MLETSKERFLIIRHSKNAQPASADNIDGIVSDKPTFTISLIQGEVEVTEGVSTLPTKPEDLELVPAEEEPKSPLPVPEQPTKEPSPVEPLPPVSIPQESKDSGRGRSMSVVDMELDTPSSVTPTVTANPDIPSTGTLLNGGLDAALQSAKSMVNTNQPRPESATSQAKAPLPENVSEKAEAIPSVPPSPASVTSTATARPEVPTLTSIPAPQPKAQGLPRVKFKLQILQRNVREEDLVFGDDGLGILSVDVDPLDNTKKGWLIETPRWRRYNTSTLDSSVVD